ncbi:MAG: hypothetical protein VYD24_05195, partial [Bacteroidota bacterium]|nr:hypothetical protein [Bacteroidota bacterium]
TAKTRLEKRFIISRFRAVGDGLPLWMHDALLDRDHLVRRQALLALDTIPREYREDVESMLSDASYVNIALALDALCEAFPDDKQGFINQVAMVDNSTVKIYGLKHLIEEDNKAVE